MTKRKYPQQTAEQLRAEMKAAARKMWDEADIQVSPHLANAIRRAAQAGVDQDVTPTPGGTLRAR